MDHVSKHRARKAAEGTAKAPTPPPQAPKPRRVPPTAAERDERLQAKGRLPAGSYFLSCWDGAVWKIMLSLGVGKEQIEVVHDGLFRGQELADDAYRASLKPKEQP